MFTLRNKEFFLDVKGLERQQIDQTFPGHGFFSSFQHLRSVVVGLICTTEWSGKSRWTTDNDLRKLWWAARSASASALLGNETKVSEEETNHFWGLKRPTIGRRRPLAGLRFRANSQDVHEKGNKARRGRGDCIPFVFSLRAFFQIQFCKFLKMTKNSTTTGLLSARNNSRLRWGAGYEAENIRSPYHIFLFTLTVIKTSSHAFRLAALSWL